MKHRQTINTDISPDVRRQVKDRDKRCIFCGRNDSLQIAHFISRAQGGLGIPQNLALLCASCHGKYDGVMRWELRDDFKNYLKSRYKGWDERKLIYDKYSGQDRTVQVNMDEIKR